MGISLVKENFEFERLLLFSFWTAMGHVYDEVFVHIIDGKEC